MLIIRVLPVEMYLVGDSLQRHIQQNHNQYGGSLKRPAAEGMNAHLV